MAEEWTPPTRDNSGRLSVADWQPLRASIEAAYCALGIEMPRDGIPRRDWDFAVMLFSHREHTSRTVCAECREPVAWRDAIRCFDCKAPLHERCAERHLWPDGRPEETLPTWKR